MLRKRIQELQTYRRLGLRSAGDIEKYDADLAKRVQPALTLFSRFDLADSTLKVARKGDRRSRLVHLGADPTEWIRSSIFRHGHKGIGRT